MSSASVATSAAAALSAAANATASLQEGGREGGAAAGRAREGRDGSGFAVAAGCVARRARRSASSRLGGSGAGMNGRSGPF